MIIIAVSKRVGVILFHTVYNYYKLLKNVHFLNILYSALLDANEHAQALRNINANLAWHLHLYYFIMIYH